MPFDPRVRSLARLCAPGLVAILATGCPNPEVETSTYFDQRIAPILVENCVNGPADNRCHIESPDLPGTAQGNLDLSSFDAIHKRPELLSSYGTYTDPVLLIKAVKPEELRIQYAGESHQSEIFHAGGGLLSRNSAAFRELQQWLQDGATIDGIPPEPEALEGTGTCSTALRPDVVPFLGQATGPTYDDFVGRVQPILREQCSFETCHGTPQSDFYVTCGDDEEQLQHNYIVTRSFVAAETQRSELLLRPLAPDAGGVQHSGGALWGSTNDGSYRSTLEWAEATGPLEPGEESPEFAYFQEHVMPVLLKRGCAMPQCHSPHGFNDFRLRAGSRGFFSPLAIARNYETTLHEFVSLDVVDPNQSRILAKNVSLANGGIEHRAGITLLSAEDDGGDPTVCARDTPEEERSSYCTVVEWIRREREAAVARGDVTAMAEGDTVPILYVDRPADADRAIDFATYRGDARLMRVDATLGPNGRLETFSEPTQVDLSGCTTATDYDVRGPEISYDGMRVAFALRAGEGDGLNIYVSNLDGSSCSAITSDGGGEDSGVPIHNFDPVFAPADAVYNPGGAIVYASTRPGRAGRAHVSPRHRLPASNIWRAAVDGSNPEQMTFLTGSELSPAFMQNGQLTMTTEKATAELYQLAGRRINWDLTDYHPLLVQRDTVGYQQATDIREAPNRDFWLIASDAAARFQGGALVAFNRSLGPFEVNRIGEPGYVGAVHQVDPAASDAGKGMARGAFRSPYAAPDGSILVSYAGGDLDITDAGAPVDYDLVVRDPRTGEQRVVAGGARFQVDGVVAYARSQRRVFVNIPELVFGGTSVGEAVESDEAWAHFPDFPMLATLLTSNQRGNRGLDALEAGDTLAIYRANLPSGSGGGETYQDWELLGTKTLREDGSAFIRAPAGVPVILELRRGDEVLLTMTEEHQFGPGEMTSLGIDRSLFDGVCGGCHGSIEGPELDVVVNPDALTAASVSLSRPSPGARPEPL